MAATPSLLRSSSEVFAPEPSAAVRANVRTSSVRTSALGLLGVTLMALGGMGAGAVPEHDPLLAWAGLSWLRYGHDLAIMVPYLGLGLVVWAWIRLGRLVRSGEAGDHAVLVAVTAWTAPLLFAPPLFSKDIYSYLAQGQLAASGVGAGFLWPTRTLLTATLASVFLLLVTFPNGDTGLYFWSYLSFALGISALAAWSLVEPDPFGLSPRYEHA